MDLRNYIGCCIASTFVMLGLAAMWHRVLMADYYALHTSVARLEPLTGYIALAYLTLSVLMTLIYPKGYSGGSRWSEGLRFGLIIGLMYALPRGIVMYSVEGTHTGTLVLVDSAWHMVEQGAGGVVIALIHGWGAGGPGR